MTQPSEERGIEREIGELKASIERYSKAAAQPTSEAVADLAKAIHELGDHLVTLHQRIERIENSNPEWTTRGWTPPPGSDRPS
jgi:uncharacterized coiled-coil DUF342 family protein